MRNEYRSSKIPAIRRPEWIPCDVWRNWRRCILRGYRNPGEGVAPEERTRAFEQDAVAYAIEFGTKPQQEIKIDAKKVTTEVVKRLLFATPKMIGRSEFIRLCARVEAGKSDPRLRVGGDAVWLVVRLQQKVIERRKAC